MTTTTNFDNPTVHGNDPKKIPTMVARATKGQSALVAAQSQSGTLAPSVAPAGSVAPVKG